LEGLLRTFFYIEQRSTMLNHPLRSVNRVPLVKGLQGCRFFSQVARQKSVVLIQIKGVSRVFTNVALG
jgi:hypothetical protein